MACPRRSPKKACFDSVYVPALSTRLTALSGAYGALGSPADQGVHQYPWGMDQPGGNDADWVSLIDEVLTRAPIGLRNAKRLVDAVTSIPDRFVEGSSLELKEVLEWDKKTYNKIAKFILGAGNRLEISQAFDGYAVMLVGVSSSGEVKGIPPRDHHAIADGVERALPSTSPQWDLLLLPHEPTGTDVLLVIVPPPPPGAPVFISQVESDGLMDGAVYVRNRSETRQARAAELRALIDREHSQAQPSAEVAALQPILFSGAAAALGSALRSLMNEEFESRIPDHEMDSSDPLVMHSRSMSAAIQSVAGAWVQSPMTHERLGAWGAAFDAYWDAEAHLWLGLLWPSSDLEVQNTSDRWLEEVEFRLSLEGPVAWTPKAFGREQWNSLRRSIPGLVPKSPYAFPPFSSLYAPPHREDVTAITTGRGVEIVVSLDRLQPRAFKRIRADFVLYAVGDCGSGLEGSWTMTARRFDAQFIGKVHFPISEVADLATAAQAIYADKPEEMAPPIAVPD